MTTAQPDNKVPSSLIFLIGFMGSGKSLISRGIGESEGAETIEMDDEIEASSGMSINKIFATRGESYFRDLERTILHELIQKYHNHPNAVLISTGGGVPCHFDNMEVMKRAGTVIFIDVSTDRLTNRLESKKQDRPLIRDKTTTELRSYVSAMREERLPYYLQAQIRVNPVSDDKELNILLLRDILQGLEVL